MTQEKSDKNHKYLIDTSALYPMLLGGVAIDSNLYCVSALTEYEVGNILWKEATKNRLKDPNRVAQIFNETLSKLEKYQIDTIQDVLKIALDRSLTFYDASYTYIAEKNGMLLITEDKDLLKKTNGAVRISDIK